MIVKNQIGESEISFVLTTETVKIGKSKEVMIHFRCMCKRQDKLSMTITLIQVEFTASYILIIFYNSFRVCLDKYLRDAQGSKGTKYLNKWCNDNPEATHLTTKMCKMLYVIVRLLQNAR